MTDKVAAVVVTYNRKELLVNCLEKILHQTYMVDQIIVVDNNSTDGTSNYLAARGYLKNPRVTYLYLAKNLGGAGGFHEGMKYAFVHKYDWLWLMDDDGYPVKDCLEKMLILKNSVSIVGATVVRPKSDKKLTWSLIRYGTDNCFSPLRRITSYKELKSLSKRGLYRGYAVFFNAVLIHRRVIDEVGFVNPDFFIRGDEFNFFLRARKAKIPMGTSVEAFYNHPWKPFSTNKMKYFYTFRNLFFNYTQYREVTYAPPFNSIYLIYMFFRYLCVTPSFKPTYLFAVMKAVCAASRGVLIPYTIN